MATLNSYEGLLPPQPLSQAEQPIMAGPPAQPTPIHEIVIPDTLFPEMLAAIPSMAQRCVSILLDRVREVTRIEQQSEKLTALGKLAANLAHELNNPASAAQRSAASLFGELREYGELKY